MANIRVQVPHEDGVSPKEFIKRLIDVCKVIHVSQVKLSSNERCPLYSGDDFTDLHVWSVEARGLDVPSHRSIPCNQSSTTNNKSLWIRTSGLTTSECGTGYYYGQGGGGGQRRSQSDKWILQTSTRACVCGCLAGGGGFSNFSSCNLSLNSCFILVCGRRSGRAHRPQKYQV